MCIVHTKIFSNRKKIRFSCNHLYLIVSEKRHPEEVKAEDLEIFTECYQKWCGVNGNQKGSLSLYVRVCIVVL